MSKWTFFFEEGNVSSETKTDAEDMRILEHFQADAADGTKKWLLLPTDTFDLRVNMTQVKCVMREDSVVAVSDANEE